MLKVLLNAVERLEREKKIYTTTETVLYNFKTKINIYLNYPSRKVKSLTGSLILQYLIPQVLKLQKKALLYNLLLLFTE